MDRLGRRVSRRRASMSAAALALTLGGALAGCGSDQPRPASAPEQFVRVSESNFTIAASAPTVTAGPLRLQIHNAGPDRHELIILPLRLGEPATALARRPDGFTVDEERLAGQEPGSINPQSPGGTRELSVTLSPGRYVLFCNMEGHYMAGMHTVLVVTP